MSITFIYGYYNNSQQLARHFELWRSYPESVRAELHFLLIDDGSPQPLLLPVELPIQVEVYRILEDIGWNNGGARNLGAQMARDEWLFLCDIDHFVPAETAESMLQFVAEAPRRSYFTFEALAQNRLRIPPPNIFLIRRSDFWRAGGYDEDLAGNYGGEDILFRQFLDRQLEWVHTRLLLLAEEDTQYDPPATRGDRTKLEINDAQLKAKLADKGYRPSRSLRFPWSKVAEADWRPTQRDDAVVLTPPHEISPEFGAWENKWHEAAEVAAGGALEAARQLYEELLTNAPADHQVLVVNNLAVVAACLGDLEHSRNVLQRLAELRPAEEVLRHNHELVAHKSE